MNAKEELNCTNLCPMIIFVCLCLLFSLLVRVVTLKHHFVK